MNDHWTMIQKESIIGCKINGIIRKAGADVNISGGELTVSRKNLNPINVDVSGCPDLFPVQTTSQLRSHNVEHNV